MNTAQMHLLTCQKERADLQKQKRLTIVITQDAKQGNLEIYTTSKIILRATKIL